MSLEDLKELVDILAQTPVKVTSLASDLSDHDVRVKNSPEEFSALENVCHLRDIEIEGYRARISRILEETNPLLPDIDGSRLAVEREYQAQELGAALQDFTRARASNIQTLRTLSREQFERAGTLEGVGIVTLKRLLEMMCDHDEDHMRELNIIHHRHRAAARV